MSIRRSLVVAFALLIACLVAQALIALRLSESQDAAARAEERRHASFALAYELRQSSDDLTRLARTYAETGDERFQTYFGRVLAIRDGKAPRPEGYPGTFWDEVCASHTPPASTGARVSIDSLMHAQGFTETEFRKLAEAKALSDGLVTLENRAMNAMVGRFDGPDGPGTTPGPPDAPLARALLHGPEYHRAKALIMRPIAEAFELVSTRTQRETGALRDDTHALGRLAIGIAVAAVAVGIASLLWLRRRVVAPLRDLGSRLADVVEGARDLTRRVEIRRRDEIGNVAGRFNEFLAGLQGGLREASGASRTVALVADDVSEAGRRQQEAAELLGASTKHVVDGVGQIAARAAEISSVAQEVASTVQATGAEASAGRQGLLEMNETMQALATGTHDMGERLQAIARFAAAITDVVTAMTKVTDRTNLLSVNAAVEAEKAGEQGRGFRVVAEEIRRLSDESAEATLKIEGSVRSMQDSARAGVAEMDHFAARMEGTIGAATKVARRMEAVGGQVEGLGARFRRLEDALEQQARGVEQIRGATSGLSQASQQSQQVADAVARGTSSLAQAVGALRTVIGQFRLEAAPTR